MSRIWRRRRILIEGCSSKVKVDVDIYAIINSII